MKCGAKTKFGGKCQHVAGHRTHHKGTGKCFLHGGAPKGNKNAYKHGRYAKTVSNDISLTFEDIFKLQEIKESTTVEPELDLFNQMYQSRSKSA